MGFSSCLISASSVVWRCSTASKRSQTSAGDGPWRLPAAAAPVARRTGGNSLDCPAYR
ncbi:hypothetical protein PF005_g4993 [Phytophthora fragariae]|uniref:Uncharacterized protein n=1 Tax=Phytophthora fragariae TaxID=53985 RepID=A0A6A4EUU6_9STRA|nr:hypothetical protein PF003_g4728 [Phytophthora fragariae]KAE8948374.1 hypothetical protein PF009_g2044 [Phytophthora fragariae]KAE9028918.1 hypothetical protein PF011_g1324 [Phytophthora fragariae]KAE9136900.1 hypothetical protein PF010_g1523 [Phytophthora fragariae]KAE9136921.1 hypothetical protein PF007_g1996 [Phytophthora fragariae]